MSHNQTRTTASITTGLLTLSVHDNLTFEGVEVALHPDLFANIEGGGGGSANVNVGTGPTHSRQPSRDGSTSSAFAYQHQHQHQYHHSRDASFASYSTAQNTPLMNYNNNLPATPILFQEDGDTFMNRGVTPTPTDSINTSPKSSNTLKEGDLIEIKVWEQKINHGQNSGRNNNVSSGEGGSNSFNVVDRAVSKLQQHVGVTNAASGSASAAFQTMYHPLATMDQNKKLSSISTSARPPIAPRTFSNASSAAASPKHTGPLPSLSPTSKSPLLPPSTPKHNVLPRQSNDNETIHDPKDSIVRHDITFDSNDLRTATGIDGKALSVLPGNNGNIEKLQPLDDNDFKLDNHNSQNANKPGILDHLKEMHSQQQQQQQQHHQYQDVTDLISHTHVLKTKFVMSVTEQSLNALKSSGRVQISLLKQVATLYNLSSYVQVTVTKIHKSEEASVLESVRADHVTLTIKDQFISRGEMYQFQNYFLGKWIYAGERLKTNDDMRAYVMELRNGDQELKSGFLTNGSKITFRTRSARIFWLVQISSEMWNYASSYGENSDQNGCCEIYFDKFVSFMKRLFEEWKVLDVSHSLTILFFSRSYINGKNPSSETREMITALPATSSIKRDTYGRLYEDFYKVIAENVTKSTNWESIILDVKKAFVKYPSEVGWRVSPGNKYSRVPSTAAEGNILEAINTALNVMQLHYIDRDLYRCGNSIVVVSAGSGVFEVDKDLAGITKQRMMDNGIGSDMLSLGLPPLHVAPFFLYKETSTPRPDESHDFDGWQNFFEIPHWMHLSFAAYNNHVERKAKKVDVESQIQPSIRIMGNGFIVRDKDGKIDTREVGNEEKKNNPKIQRHLISGRDFEDILEACRPRNLDNTICGMPKALVSQMKIFGLIEKKEVNDHSIKSDLRSGDFESSPDDSASDRSKSSQSAVTSHFKSTFSAVLSRSPGSTSNPSPILSSVQIQQSRSLELPSILLNEIELRSKTREFDQSIFKSDGSVIHQTTRSVAEVEVGVTSPMRTQPISGIGEAINQYENNPDLNHSVHSHLPTPQPIKSTPREPTAITRVKKALGTPNILNFHQISSRPTSMGVLEKTMDKPNYLDVTQHTVVFRPSTPREILMTLPKSMQGDDTCLMTAQSKKERLANSNKDLSSEFSSSPRGRRAHNSMSPPGRMKLNVKPARITNLAPKTQTSQKLKNGVSPASRRKQWVLNPFKQEDEDEFLAERNYNSRRWSHVFPQGETEFKRHAGPNFKSLCQPAILPLEIDVFPTKEELEVRYENRFHAIHLAAMEKTFYKSHTDLLMEMVRQRLVQDYQLVLQDVYTESRKKTTRNADAKPRKLSNFPSELSSSRNKDNPRKQKDSSENNLKIALSMGHCFQTIQYLPDVDSVRVDSYSRDDARNVGGNQFQYTFQLWLPASKRYTSVHQSFDKYPAEYNWNGFDNLICGDHREKLIEGTRYRRVSFRIVPDSFQDPNGEQEYVKKIMKIIDFLEKQAQKNLGIKISTVEDRTHNTKSKVDKRNEGKITFIVHLRKRKHDKYEWMQVVTNSIFDTKRAFHITFNWLVASAVKIEAQVQLLQRRCSQFGLNLVSATYASCDSNFYLHPLIRPESIFVHSLKKAYVVEQALINKYNFCDDGEISVHHKDAKLSFGVEYDMDYSKRRWFQRTFLAQQYINRAGTLFIRLLLHKRENVLFVFLENRKHMGSNNELLDSTRKLQVQLKEMIEAINSSDMN